MPDTATLATPITAKSPKTRPVQSRAASDIKELQRLIMDSARTGERDAKLAQLARAYVDCQDMRLRMAMKPAPKPIDVSQRKSRRQRSSDAPAAPAPSPVLPDASITPSSS